MPATYNLSFRANKSPWQAGEGQFLTSGSANVSTDLLPELATSASSVEAPRLLALQPGILDHPGFTDLTSLTMR